MDRTFLPIPRTRHKCLKDAMGVKDEGIFSTRLKREIFENGRLVRVDHSLKLLNGQTRPQGVIEEGRLQHLLFLGLGKINSRTNKLFRSSECPRSLISKELTFPGIV